MAVDGSTRSGMFKQVFGKLEETVPEFAVLQSDIPFKEQAKVGEGYYFPIRFRRGHGITMESGSTSLTAFALAAVNSGQTAQANVSGATFVARESFASKAVYAAEREGPRAFANLFADGVEDIQMTTRFYLEAFMLYGQTSFGSFSEAGPNATTATLDITVAACAPGLLAQLEGAYIDVYSDTAFGTKRNSSNPIQVTGFDYNPATGVGALSLSGTATDIDAIALGDVFVPDGWYESAAHKSFAGLDKILLNTSTIFGINSATYPSWAGTSYSCGSAALTFKKIITAAVGIMVRCGMRDESLRCYVSPATWTDLMNNTASLRRYAENNNGKVELGSRRIVFYNVTGSIEIVPHAMIKQGEAFMGFPSVAIRGGVTEPTFNANKGTNGQTDEYVIPLASNMGFEIRMWFDQFLILTRPKGWVKITDIVNSF